MLKINTSGAMALTPLMQEEFRSLYTNIEFSGADNKVICVTSSFPNEGKSYVSYELAKVMAEGNKKVVLVDADLRNSSFYRKLEFSKENTGLSHLLSKKANINEVIYQIDESSLYFIPTGVFVNNPTTLFRQEYFKSVINSLKEHFDYVIIDTPPIGMVTDGTIVANVSDASILVIGSEMEGRTSAKESISMLESANASFLGVVLNKKERKTSRYGRYGKYGKYARYGYGEGAKE